MGAVGDAVVHGGQVGQVEHIAHQCPALGGELTLHMIVFGEGKVDGDGLGAGAHLQFTAVVGEQQLKLLQQVVAVQVGAGDRGLESARSGHKAVAQAARSLVGRAVGVQAHKGVTGAHPLLGGIGAVDKVAHGGAQVVHAALVDGLDLCQGGFGVGVKNRRCKVGRFVHGVYCDQAP